MKLKCQIQGSLGDTVVTRDVHYYERDTVVCNCGNTSIGRDNTGRLNAIGITSRRYAGNLSDPVRLSFNGG